MSTKTSTAPQLKSVALTVYSAGFALVEGTYALSLGEGTNHIQLEGMPSQLDQSSLYPDQFAGPGEVTLGPITFRTPNLNPQSLLKSSLNKYVTLVYGGNLSHEQSTISGKLLYLNQDTALLLVDGDRVREVRHVKGATYGGVPDGVSNTPALSLTVQASQSGEYTAVLLFTTRGVNWSPEYKFILDEENSKLEVDGWLVLANQSGATYKAATLSVAAGDAGETFGGLESAGGAVPAAQSLMLAAAPPRGGSAKRSVASVQEIGQVKIYDVPGAVTIEEGDSQKVPFFNAKAVPVELEYRIAGHHGWYRYSQESEQQARRVLIVKNDEESKLGKPLPGARVTVLQRDANDRLRQTGQGSLEDLPVGDEANVDTGEDFDIHLTRRVLATSESESTPVLPANEKDTRPQRKVTYHRQCQVDVFNGKDRPVKVVLEEILPPDATLSATSRQYKKVHDGRYETSAEVAPRSRHTITFTVTETVQEYLTQR